MEKFKDQRELFDWVWSNRPHVSEIDGSPLYPIGHFMWHWQCCHILGKGTYPHYKLNPENIILMTVEQHKRQETHPIFIEKRDELRREYYKEFYGKEF